MPYLGNVLYKSMLCSDNELKDKTVGSQGATKRFCFLPHQMECGIEFDTLFSTTLQYSFFPPSVPPKETVLTFHQVVITMETIIHGKSLGL